MAFELKDDNFQTEVLDSGKISLVDFWAPWCGPCLALGPTIDAIHEEYSDKVLVGKVNVDENPETAVKYGVRSIPTILFFKDGEVVDKLVGNSSKSTFTEKLDQLLG